MELGAIDAQEGALVPDATPVERDVGVEHMCAMDIASPQMVEIGLRW